MSRKWKLTLSAIACGSLAIAATIVGYEDWQLRGSAPGNPASGYLRIWADNTGGFFKCLTSAGASCYWAASPASASAVQGNGSLFQLSTGTATSGHCVKYDANGNTVDAGAACGTGGSITLQTNGTNNGSQSTLNLAAGTNMTLSDNGSGTITFGASGGGGGGAWTQVSKQTLASPAASVSFSGISGSYTDLELRYTARCTATINQAGVGIRLNGDSATNYNYVSLFNNSSVSGAVTNSDSYIFAAAMPCANGTANFFGSGFFHLFNYSSTAFFKSVNAYGMGPISVSGTNQQQSTYGAMWRNTAAVTSITVVTDTGTNFATGSIFTLWGIT